MRRSLVPVLIALGLVVAACGADPGSDRAGADETTETAPTSAAPSTPPPSETTTTTAAPGPSWELVEGGEGCSCSDGSDWNLWVREADPTRVVLYFQGGGACFSAETCGTESETYDRTVDATDDPSGYGGIFDFENPANPLADWSVVFVPYCTGDVHLGDKTNDYGNGVVVEHKGMVNGLFALDELERRFPDPAEVFVTGSSAGGVPSPLFAGLASDRFPDAAITALADASGAYADNPAVNAGIGALWGTFDARPDWPELAAITPEQWGIPRLFVYAGEHDPDIALARYDNAFDQVQASFAAATGIGNAPLVDLIDGNEELIEGAGVEVDSYVAPGTNHTILGRPEVYTLEVEGVPFIDWLTDLVERQPVDDVHCTACSP